VACEEILVKTAETRQSWHLFLEHRKQLLAYARHLLPDRQDDIVQEVGLRILLQPAAPVAQDQFGAWCRSIARNVVLEELRTVRYERAKVVALDETRHRDVWDSELRAAARLTVLRQLEGIDAVARELLLRRYVLEQTSEEIARDMQLSAAAVRMRLMRLRELLTSSGLESATTESGS
jgi:RNA polymerase sigma factor (sigma-70 family)